MGGEGMVKEDGEEIEETCEKRQQTDYHKEERWGRRKSSKEMGRDG